MTTSSPLKHPAVEGIPSNRLLEEYHYKGLSPFLFLSHREELELGAHLSLFADGSTPAPVNFPMEFKDHPPQELSPENMRVENFTSQMSPASSLDET
ncbi:hypothetical protein P7K49_006919 [Saguinus oedipus]|uniref:Uncharacterized protein n=1 Tax=Saguinus oedipus TaxID=9490 RepID=A0ABQ9W3T7_SAGOE|nr:hypothetical protein P7K49_006919 [Saguinus oedipus]